jgi:hypothetical protein
MLSTPPENVVALNVAMQGILPLLFMADLACERKCGKATDCL